MEYLNTRMSLAALAMAALVAVVHSAGDEYLPPNKGYNYDRPPVPFPTNTNSNSQPPPPRPTYGPPSRPPPSPPRNTYPPAENHDDHHHHEPGMPFDFAYAVNEDGNDFSHSAVSDGDVTRGEYRIALPDGRTQLVKYTADWKNGYNAEVTYEGEARYPDQPQGGYSSGGGGGGGGQAYVPPQQGGGYKY